MKSMPSATLAPARRSLTGVVCIAALLWGSAAWAEDFSARLDWTRRVTLSTLVSGTVSEVAVEPGQQVERGAVLVRLDPRRFEAVAREAEARTNSLAQKNEEAQRELERAEELYDRTVLSDRDLQLAKIAAATAEADHRAAQAAEVRAGIDLEYSVVRAPFSGVVLDVPAQLGQTVITTTRTEPLVVLAGTGEMIARLAVAPPVLDRLAAGQAVRVTARGKTYSGRIARLGLEPLGEGDDRYPVEVIFDADGDRLRAGGEATVSL